MEISNLMGPGAPASGRAGDGGAIERLATTTGTNRSAAGSRNDLEKERGSPIGFHPFHIAINKGLELPHPIKNKKMILRKMTAGVAFSAAGAFPAISGLAAQTRDESTAKMKLSIKLLSDGFPGEQDTPEGAAAEHALGLYDI